MRQHAALRKQAEECAWKPVVQREAMGLFHHAVVAEKYPIPPPINPYRPSPTGFTRRGVRLIQESTSLILKSIHSRGDGR